MQEFGRRSGLQTPPGQLLSVHRGSDGRVGVEHEPGLCGLLERNLSLGHLARQRGDRAPTVGFRELFTLILFAGLFDQVVG